MLTLLLLLVVSFYDFLSILRFFQFSLSFCLSFCRDSLTLHSIFLWTNLLPLFQRSLSVCSGFPSSNRSFFLASHSRFIHDFCSVLLPSCALALLLAVSFGLVLINLFLEIICCAKCCSSLSQVKSSNNWTNTRVQCLSAWWIELLLLFYSIVHDLVSFCRCLLINISNFLRFLVSSWLLFLIYVCKFSVFFFLFLLYFGFPTFPIFSRRRKETSIFPQNSISQNRFPSTKPLPINFRENVPLNPPNDFI